MSPFRASVNHCQVWLKMLNQIIYAFSRPGSRRGVVSHSPYCLPELGKPGLITTPMPLEPWRRCFSPDFYFWHDAQFTMQITAPALKSWRIKVGYGHVQPQWILRKCQLLPLLTVSKLSWIQGLVTHFLTLSNLIWAVASVMPASQAGPGTECVSSRWPSA